MRRAKAVLSWTTPLWIASDSPDILALFAGRDSFSPIRFRVTLSTSHGSQKIMIDLYAAGTSNGMRARIGLEECGLAYNFHPIDLTKGEQKSPSFLARSEEHTSELQSPDHLVCRLLLEKKKKKKYCSHIVHH